MLTLNCNVMKLMDTSHIDVLGLMCSFYYSCSKIEYNNTTVVVNTMNAPNNYAQCHVYGNTYSMHVYSLLCNMYNIPKRTIMILL